MKDRTYREWVASNVAETYGTCKEVTERMAVAFPELRRVRGHYYCPIWGERAHWWLVSPEDGVVDPTATQFPSGGLGQYVEWDDSQPEPTGKCANCGEYCYDGRTCCSEFCHIAHAAYCSNPY